MNKSLEQLYIKNFEGFLHICSTLKDHNIDDYSWPLLLNICVDEFNKASTKIMIIGQETNGWSPPIYSIEDIRKSMNFYGDFTCNKKNANTSFWKTMYYINEIFGNKNSFCFVWNNILKLGKSGDSGRPISKVTELENEYFNLLTKEIEIIKPDVCIFLTGPNYDNDIKAKIIDVKFEAMKGYLEREFCLLRSNFLPLHSYRTYHPGFGLYYKDWYYKILNTISNRYRNEYCKES